MEFANGNPKLELDQADVAIAVEFWLNERILKRRCVVSNITKANNQWQPMTFKVTLQEVCTEDGADAAWDAANLLADLVGEFPAGDREQSNAWQAAQDFLCRVEQQI